MSLDEMVDVAVTWIDRISEKLKTEYAHGLLRDYIRDRLEQGILPTKAVIDRCAQWKSACRLCARMPRSVRDFRAIDFASG